MIKNRCIGKFAIPIRILNNQPSVVLDFMFGMLVIEAECNLAANEILYTAISPKHFKGIPHGERAPEYFLRISNNKLKLDKERNPLCLDRK